MLKQLFNGNIIAGLCLVAGAQSLAAQQDPKGDEVARELEISYTSEIVATRSGTAVSIQDIAGRMATVPDDRRNDVLGSPERIASVLNGVLLSQYLADAAIDRGLLSDSAVQAEIYLAAMEILARKERDEYVQERLLDDYSSQARETYLLNPESFRQPERITFTHLLLRSNKTDPDAEAVKSRAEALLERARNGEDVSDLALQYSDDPSIQDNGGLLRDVPVDDLEPTFRAEIRNLAEGDLALIESGYGYHVVKVNELNASRVQSFEEVAARLREEARAEHAKEIFERYAAEFYEGELNLREGAVAKIIERFITSQRP